MTIDALLQLVTTAKIINTTRDGDRQVEIRDGSGELVGRFWSFESDLEWSLDQCFDHIQNKHPELICKKDRIMQSINIKIPAATCRAMGLQWDLWSTVYTVDVPMDAITEDEDGNKFVIFDFVGWKIEAYFGIDYWLVDTTTKIEL